jgi:predicted DNA-binding ribbon-helix-helix protein
MTYKNKIRTTVVVEKDTMKSLKKIAIDRELTQNQLINEFIEYGILKNKKYIE